MPDVDSSFGRQLELASKQANTSAEGNLESTSLPRGEASSPLHRLFGLLPKRANNFFWRGPFLVPVQAPLFDLVVQHCRESSIGSWYC